MLTTWNQPSTIQRSLLALLHPRGQARLFGAALAAAVVLGWLSITRLSVPLWSAAILGVALLAVPALRKWHRDRQSLGSPAMVLSILLATQSLHTVEHIAQWLQYHVLDWPLKASSGIISPLNAEIVHFTGNVSVLLVVV